MVSFCKVCGYHPVCPCVKLDMYSLMDVYACRDDLTMLLAKAGSSLTVKALLENLQITTDFENSMVKKWASSVRVFFGTSNILLLISTISFKQYLLQR